MMNRGQGICGRPEHAQSREEEERRGLNANKASSIHSASDFYDVDFILSATPEPSRSTSDDNGFIPFATPEPSSITIPLHRLPATYLRERCFRSFRCTAAFNNVAYCPRLHDGFSYIRATNRSASLSTGGDDFVPSAVPGPSSIRAPLLRLPASSAPVEDDGSAPSAVP